ncbi:MAG: hypothetical protein E7677_01930 [Ruminococcaceae bacterium]|nr:hypothetical protein [Oscillospiraceae bacterium]
MRISIRGLALTKTDFFKRLTLSGNALKFIAAFCMVVDHVGIVLFPREEIFRIVGRIAFPLFAYMLAEGCVYTRNKLKHFLLMLSFASVCQIGYTVFTKDTYMSILVTFSIAILLIYVLGFFKNTLFSDKHWIFKILTGLLFVAALVSAYHLNKSFEIDYGFAGCVLPLLPTVFRKPKGADGKAWQVLDNKYVHVAMFALGLSVFSAATGGRQWFSLLAIPLLLLYSEKRGKLKTKYFFYIFYPAHLVLIYGIDVLISILGRGA